MANPYTIDLDSIRGAKLIVDIDNFKTKYVQKSDFTKVFFVSPSLPTFDRFRYVLLKNSVKKQMTPRYQFRPDYLSYDEYGTVILWPLLLYINDIPSIEEFDIPEAIIPDFATINELTNYGEALSPIEDVDVLNAPPSKTKLEQLYSTKMVPKPDPVITAEVTDMPSFVRQIFALDSTQLYNRYIDLAYEPIKESVTLKVVKTTSDVFIPVYTVHYAIIKDSSNIYKRVSWAATDCPNGSGMESDLVLSEIIEVQYAKKETS